MSWHVPVILLPAAPCKANRGNLEWQLHTTIFRPRNGFLNPFSTQHTAKSTYSHVESVVKYSCQNLFHCPSPCCTAKTFFFSSSVLFQEVHQICCFFQFILNIFHFSLCEKLLKAFHLQFSLSIFWYWWSFLCNEGKHKKKKWIKTTIQNMLSCVLEFLLIE